MLVVPAGAFSGLSLWVPECVRASTWRSNGTTSMSIKVCSRSTGSPAPVRWLRPAATTRGSSASRGTCRTRTPRAPRSQSFSFSGTLPAMTADSTIHDEVAVLLRRADQRYTTGRAR